MPILLMLHPVLAVIIRAGELPHNGVKPTRDITIEAMRYELHLLPDTEAVR